MSRAPGSRAGLPLRFAPILAYAAVYVFTCLIGAIVFLSGYRPFAALYEYFSGSPVPTLAGPALDKALLLLLLAPVLLAAGFAVGTMRLREAPRMPRDDAARWVGRFAFVLLAALGFVFVGHAGAFSHLGSWLNYGDWVVARDAMFANISFATFVDVYVLVPATAAWVVVAERGGGKGSLAFRLAVSATAVLLCLLLFQKKAALVAILLITTSAILASRHRSSARRIGRQVGLLAAGLLAIYIALVVAPVVSKTSKTVNQAVAAQKAHGELTSAQKSQQRHLRGLAREVDVKNRTKTIALYATLAPLTRTSAAALYYPVVYPSRHGFYGLDVGQDVLGIGSMPDDNLVVWNVMNPATPGGRVAAPYQFPLYSQVGIVGALLISIVYGALLGLLWRFAVGWIRSGPAASAFGALVVLLGVYLALDSARNAVLVSYGVIWGLIAVAALAGLTRLVLLLATRHGTLRAPAADATAPRPR